VTFGADSPINRREAMITIKKVATAEPDTAISAIVEGFSADPAARWMYPDSQQYWKHFPSFVKALAGDGRNLQSNPSSTGWVQP
jgi:hypothetical protein